MNRFERLNTIKGWYRKGQTYYFFSERLRNNKHCAAPFFQQSANINEENFAEWSYDYIELSDLGGFIKIE